MAENNHNRTDHIQKLQDYILHLEVSGDLDLRGSSVAFTAEELPYVFDDSVIINVRINGLKVAEFYEKLRNYKLAVMLFIRNQVVLELPPLINYRIYQDAKECVDFTLHCFERDKPKTIIISNKDDITSLRTAVFRKLQNDHLLPVNNFIIKRILQELLTELSEELKYLKESNSHHHKLSGRAQSPSSDIQTFEELFYDPADAEPCLSILKNLDPPYIDSVNQYVGRNKGMFPLWISALKSYAGNPIIKHVPDMIYKDMLNAKIEGLELSKDASEFRKVYARMNDRIKEDIQLSLSQLSLYGKSGK